MNKITNYPNLKELHWLKVQEIIEFKVILLTFKCLNNLAPSYLTELLQYNNISGSRAPTLKQLLCNSTVGDRAFISYAPRLWDKLPQELKQCSDINAFKRILKTFLFQNSYDIILVINGLFIYLLCVEYIIYELGLNMSF